MLLFIRCYDYHSIDSLSEPKSQVGSDYKTSLPCAQPVTLPASQPAAPQPAVQHSQTVSYMDEQAQPTSLPQPAVQHSRTVGYEQAQPTTLPEPQPINGAPPHAQSFQSQVVSRQPMSPPQALHETPIPRQALTSQRATLPEGQPVSPPYAQLQTLPQGQPVAPPALQPTPVAVHYDGDHFLSEVYGHWVSIILLL